jgi:hypothetical protein
LLPGSSLHEFGGGVSLVDRANGQQLQGTIASRVANGEQNDFLIPGSARDG